MCSKVIDTLRSPVRFSAFDMRSAADSVRGHRYVLTVDPQCTEVSSRDDSTRHSKQPNHDY